MTRQEHVAWCKERALAELDGGSVGGALASLMSDLGKHPDTEGHPAREFGIRLLMAGLLDRPWQMRQFIEGCA